MGTPSTRSLARTFSTLFTFVMLLLALAQSGSSEAGVVRQLTDRRTTEEFAEFPFEFPAWALDDTGTSVFVNATTNQLGGNPEHRFQIFKFDAATGAGQQLTSFSKGVSGDFQTVSVSDDGQWLAFVSRSDPVGQNHDASPELFVMRADGSGLAQLTNDPAVNAGSVLQAAISGSANRIAFLSNSNPLGANPAGRVQLFIVNFDGSGLRQLTTDAASPGTVYWYGVSISDDGQRLAFSTTANLTGGNADGGTEVFAVQADGSNLRQLTSAPSRSFDSLVAVISGNGTKIAFESDGNFTGQNADGTYEIFAINWDGTGMRQLTSSINDALSPSITDDGQWVYFSLAYGTTIVQIWKAKTDGSILTQVPYYTDGNLQQPVASGGGDRIAFVRASAPPVLDVMTGSGTAVRQLVLAQEADSESPEITRDGTRIVFESNANPLGTNPDGGFEIFRIEADGTGLAQVTNFANAEAFAPSITADGNTIVFDSNADPFGTNSDGSHEIFKIHADGTGLQQLTLGSPSNDNSTDPKISANGSMVVFLTEGNSKRVYSMHSDGTGVRMLSSGPFDGYPRIDDAGIWTTFMSNGNLDGTAPNATHQVWRMRTDGTEIRRISIDATRLAYFPDISASGNRIVYVSAQDPLGTNPAHRYQVFLYDITTNTTRQLTFSPSPVGSVSAASISGDGNLVFINATAPYDEPDPDLRVTLYRVPATGGPIERIGATVGAPAPNYTPNYAAPRPNMTGSKFAFEGYDDTTDQNPDLSSEVWVGDMTKDPEIRVSRTAPTLVSWDYEAGSIRYDVIRGDVANLSPGPSGTVGLGSVVCLENDSPDADTRGFEDAVQPPVGHAFFYLFRGSRGLNYGPGSWGQATNGQERVPGTGACTP